jgi:sugar phosphate isomerase/epimerase
MQVIKMNLGVFTVLFGHLSFDQMIEKVAELGFDCIELGTGAYPGSAHCNPMEHPTMTL